MAQETASRSLDKIIVRLPDGMRDRLKEVAEQNNRSVNAEVVARLEQSFMFPPNGSLLSLGKSEQEVIKHIADMLVKEVTQQIGKKIKEK
ncbi:Arc family DNA-binding protein [Brucella sp. 2280]|uniref:Arc family DNA-binding protein n=1 Tax=Brucella sp. 2280 TaxID=2592625 RepID=UPI001295D256|nr:Arc family DNA-binding protein [Brucella sp. 2280]QGA55856.1 Arc family DNA-binding protein [Brucella sp. 2280]